MTLVKNTSAVPVDVDSGRTIASGEFADVETDKDAPVAQALLDAEVLVRIHGEKREDYPKIEKASRKATSDPHPATTTDEGAAR